MTRMLFLFVSLITCASESRGQDQPPVKPIGVLLAAGDIAKCSSTPSKTGKQKETAELLGAEIAKAESAGIEVRVLALGDLAYDHGRDFGCFDESWGKYYDRMLPVPGNHDYETKAAGPYFKYFETTLTKLKASKEGLYAVNFPHPTNGPWHLIALNSNIAMGRKSAQSKWLEADLESTKKMPCILAFSHAFFYSSGRHGHGENSQIDLTAQPRPLELLRPTYETLVAYRASVFLAGHDHHFEQLSRTDDKEKANGEGVRSFVVGTGGFGLYQNDYQHKWLFREAYTHEHHGVLKIELFENRYKWDFITVDGGKISLPTTADSCNRST